MLLAGSPAFHLCDSGFLFMFSSSVPTLGTRRAPRLWQFPRPAPLLGCWAAGVMPPQSFPALSTPTCGTKCCKCHVHAQLDQGSSLQSTGAMQCSCCSARGAPHLWTSAVREVSPPKLAAMVFISICLRAAVPSSPQSNM